MSAALVPELEVSGLAVSVGFYVEVCGFAVAYERPEERFAYLEREGAELMLQEAEPERPLGRGVSFQIPVSAARAPARGALVPPR